MPDLPKLTDIEEILIARVQVAINVFQVRGLQFQYRGHVAHFLKDVARVYAKLPLLPSESDVIILRPRELTTGELGYFRRRFTVRRAVVQQWLTFLRLNHPGYQDVIIDEANLATLPANASVLDNLTVQFEDVQESNLDTSTQTQQAESGEGRQDQSEGEDYDVTSAAVPDLLPRNTDIGLLQDEIRLNEIGGQDQRQPASLPHLTMPHRATDCALDEWNSSSRLLSLAFPSLYPRGEADYWSTRPRGIDFKQYCAYLLKYQDGRFAGHSRWRYTVFNIYLRQQTRKRSAYVAKNLTRNGPISLEEVQEAFANPDAPEGRRLLNSIVRQSATIRGTRSFWNGKRQELDAYVRALGSPTLFMTASAADLQWDSLIRLSNRYREWKEASSTRRIAISREFLKDNPHLAVQHFQHRLNLFFSHVLKPKLRYDDYWIRYEFQGRGSVHAHWFLWIQDAPPIDLKSIESREHYAQFWGLHITAMNPEPARTVAPTAIGAIHSDSTGVRNDLGFLSDVVNRVQRHTCNDSCLRRHRGQSPNDPTRHCRFYFPRERLDRAQISLSRNPRYPMFCAQSNDSSMNQFIPLLMTAWRANMDVTPCLSIRVALDYIAKYCTKAEVPTTSYLDIVRSVLPRVSTTHPVVSVVAKTMNKLIVERDWSAQEVSHLLIDLPLASGSRIVITLDCRPEGQRDATIALDTAEDAELTAQRGKTLYQKYQERNPDLEQTTFFEFLTRFDTRKRIPAKLRSKTPSRIIRYIPRYRSDRSHRTYTDYCRIKAVLHIPWREYPALPIEYRCYPLPLFLSVCQVSMANRMSNYRGGRAL